MSAHTPGPWEVYRDGEVRHIVAAGSVVDEPNGTLQADWVAELEPDSTGHDEEQCEADARLIAAAPAMLAALETIERYLAAEPPSRYYALEMARAAIAAATGAA